MLLVTLAYSIVAVMWLADWAKKAVAKALAPLPGPPAGRNDLMRIVLPGQRTRADEPPAYATAADGIAKGFRRRVQVVVAGLGVILTLVAVLGL